MLSSASCREKANVFHAQRSTSNIPREIILAVLHPGDIESADVLLSHWDIASRYILTTA